jgi:tetratricopeptide (TPR) repeat protein
MSVIAFGQKREITNAWGYLKDGFLDDAKKSIDKAELNVETKDSYKTYYYKGKIYRELGVSKNKKYKALCGETCFDVAYDALMKSIKLNFTKPENQNLDLTDELDLMKFAKVLGKQDSRDFEDFESIADIVMNIFPALSNDLVNEGIKKFQEEKFEESYQKFVKASSIAITSADTQLIYLTSLAAMETNRFKETSKFCEALIKLNYGENNQIKVTIYLNLSRAYSALNDTVKMLKTLDAGISKFPQDNYPLIIEAFNFFVKIKDDEKALNYINMAIEKNPTNPAFYSIKGTLFEGMGNKDGAAEEYNKGLQIDPENFDANYQLGAMYYNAAVDTIEWANKNLPPRDFDKIREYTEVAKNLWEKSLPYLEKAYSMQPQNLNVLQTLRIIYRKTGKMDLYDKVDAEIKVLTEPKQETTE